MDQTLRTIDANAAGTAVGFALLYSYIMEKTAGSFESDLLYTVWIFGVGLILNGLSKSNTPALFVAGPLMLLCLVLLSDTPFCFSEWVTPAIREAHKHRCWDTLGLFLGKAGLFSFGLAASIAVSHLVFRSRWRKPQ